MVRRERGKYPATDPCTSQLGLTQYSPRRRLWLFLCIGRHDALNNNLKRQNTCKWANRMSPIWVICNGKRPLIGTISGGESRQTQAHNALLSYHFFYFPGSLLFLSFSLSLFRPFSFSQGWDQTIPMGLSVLVPPFNILLLLLESSEAPCECNSVYRDFFFLFFFFNFVPRK